MHTSQKGTESQDFHKLFSHTRNTLFSPKNIPIMFPKHQEDPLWWWLDAPDRHTCPFAASRVARGRSWCRPLPLLVHARRHPGRGDAQRALTSAAGTAGPKTDSTDGVSVRGGECGARSRAGGVLS